MPSAPAQFRRMMVYLHACFALASWFIEVWLALALRTLRAWLVLPVMRPWHALLHIPRGDPNFTKLLFLWGSMITVTMVSLYYGPLISLDPLCLLILPTSIKVPDGFSDAIVATMTGQSSAFEKAIRGPVPRDMLCFALAPEARAGLAPNHPHDCLKTGLSKSFLHLACDFEAHDWCSGVSCNLWFEALKRSEKELNLTVDQAAADPELSIKVINSLMALARKKFNGGLDLLGRVDKLTGRVDSVFEQLIIELGLQMSEILLWHCDESRTRPMKSKHAWTSTYKHLVLMDQKLRQYGTQTGCYSHSVSPLTPAKCYGVQQTLSVFAMLLPEYKRRSCEHTSQCSFDGVAEAARGGDL